ncbi:transposase [Mediterraneibacter gnavus]|uniref:transposase n=1 Tax=Mediterraneibacter gnavus TaxID=33038 RepID=UPI0032B794E4
MRSTSEEFNDETVIENIGVLCGEELRELPYWETINNYLKRFSSEELQKVIWRLVYRLIRSRAFEDARFRGKYWQVIIDGTQLYRSRKDLGEHSLFCRKKKGTEEEYTEYYYYVLEAKVVLHEKIQVSILTEFIENEKREVDKQDCEQKGAKRLMERLKQEFPMLKICICGDSLYASEGFFKECRKKKWKYILRYKEGSIPSINQEYEVLKKQEKNRQEKPEGVYDYVTGIDYRGESINVIEYESKEEKKKFLYVTNLSITGRNGKETVERGRWRWKIENEGFNTQKKQGYYLEHRFSHDYQGMKNHYYMIQIGHMIAQIIEAWETLWKKVKQSRTQKHRLLLNAWKNSRIKENSSEMEKKIQVRFAYS